MKYKIIVFLLVGLLFAQGCSNKNSQRNNDTNYVPIETPKEESKEELTDIPIETPTETPKKEVTVRNDILFDAHNNDFIFIEGKNMTVDGNNSTQEIDIDNDGENELFVISLDTPNGTRLSAVKGKIGFNLLDLFTEEDYSYINAFDDAGNPLEEYYFQLSFVDLDNDGKKEIIASIGNLLVEEVSVIFKTSDSNDFPFIRVGNIVGQSYMYLDENNHIVSPYGSQGLAEEYIYENGKLFVAMH